MTLLHYVVSRPSALFRRGVGFDAAKIYIFSISAKDILFHFQKNFNFFYFRRVSGPFFSKMKWRRSDEGEAKRGDGQRKKEEKGHAGPSP